MKTFFSHGVLLRLVGLLTGAGLLLAGPAPASLCPDFDSANRLALASLVSRGEAALEQPDTECQDRPAALPESTPAKEPGNRLAADIGYRTGADATESMRQHCRLDVYFPEKAKSFPTVVWFHGGGLTGGKRSVPAGLRGKGICVVAVDYRLSPETKSPGYIEDAAAAIAWTFQHIASFGGSPEAIFVSGHSAGAYLTAMTGLDKHWLAAHGIDANRIAGLIPLSPQAITHFTIRGERGISEKQPVLDELAPLFHVRKDAPPMMIVTGDREQELLGRYEENAYFWRMMKISGSTTTTLTEMKGRDHGGMAEPAMPMVLEFIKAHSPVVGAPGK